MLVVPWLAVQAFTRLRKGGLKAPGHAKLLAWNDRVIAAMRRHLLLLVRSRSQKRGFAQVRT